MSTGGSPVREAETDNSSNADQLYKIESKPPFISAKDMANHTKLAIHLLRVKAAAAHHGFVNLLVDSNTTHSSKNVSMHRRWLLESFECHDVRTLLALEGSHPYHIWQAIPRLLMPGVELNEIYSEWIQTIKWDGTTNIASYFANFLMVSKELERLGEPISNRRLKHLYVRALPETYGHVIDAANMYADDTDNPLKYISYINKAINQRMARGLEATHGVQENHPVFQAGVTSGRHYADGRRSPNRRHRDDRNNFDHTPQATTDHDRAEKYSEATISRATTEILNEYGYSASTELVEKVGRMIGDYLLFERQDEEFEVHATSDARSRPTPRLPPPSARSLQRGNLDTTRNSKSYPVKERSGYDSVAGRPGHQKLCTNCGSGNCNARTCPHPKARCSHPLCRQRGRDGHCDKVCYFQHRHLCPPKLLATRDKHFDAWQKEQHTQANYIDEDASSDDFMQLDDATNYYFYNTEVWEGPQDHTQAQGGAHEYENVQTREQGELEVNMTSSYGPEGVDHSPHCIDYLAGVRVRTFYDHLLHLAERVYRRSRTPIHSIIDVALSVIIDYLRRCVPKNDEMRAVKRFVDLHTPSTLELVKSMCHDAVIETITSSSDNGETLAGMLQRCFRRFAYLNDAPLVVASTAAAKSSDEDGRSTTDNPKDETQLVKITSTARQTDIIQTILETGVYDQTRLDEMHTYLRHDKANNPARDDGDPSQQHRNNTISERAHLALDAPELYCRLRGMSDQQRVTDAPYEAPSTILALLAGRADGRPTIYDYLEPSTSTWHTNVPLPKCHTSDARIAAHFATTYATHRRQTMRDRRRSRPYNTASLRHLRYRMHTHNTSCPCSLRSIAQTASDGEHRTPTTPADLPVTGDTSDTRAPSRTRDFNERVANVLRLVQASVTRRRRREQLGLPACACPWATANGQSCNPSLAASDYQRIANDDLCMNCSQACQCTCEGCTIPFLDEHPCACGAALRNGGFCTETPAVYDSVGRTHELRRCTGCADPAQCQCTCPQCTAGNRTQRADDNTPDDVAANNVENFELYAMQHDHSRSLVFDFCADELPAALRCMTYAIVDTGASAHLENGEGAAGFETRDNTSATVSTGLSAKSPCDFSGTHIQYMLGCAPAYDIICFKRPAVLCHKTFKRSLFSVRAAWADSRIRARFDDECALLLADGRRIPFYQMNNTYVLPRWFSLADAESARALLLSSARTIPLTCSSGHDDWVQAALHRTAHGPEYNLVEHAAQAFFRNNDDAGTLPDNTNTLTLSPGRLEPTTLATDRIPKSAARVITLYHQRFGHLAPKALLQLPNAVLGADDLRRVTREQAERLVGSTCDTCARARMMRKPHQKRALRTHSTTDPTHAFGDCVSTDNAGPLPPSFAHLFRYLTVFVDHFTSLIAVYFHVTKGLVDSIPVREQYIADHSIYGTVKRFLSDSAPELMGRTMRTRMAQRHQCSLLHTVPGESDLNNRAEAVIYLLFAMARALRIQSGMPMEHWPAMLMYSAYIRNRVPLRSMRDGTVTTRLALARGQPHTIAEIRMFGCVCHGMLQRKDRDNKLSDVAQSGIFVGFPRYQQGGAVCIWVPNDTRPRYRVAYSVRFDESRTYQDAWRLTPTPLVSEEDTQRRLHQPVAMEQRVEERAVECADCDSPTAALLPEARRANHDGGDTRTAALPSTSTDPPTRPPPDSSACGRVDPEAARRHPTRPTDFACRLPNGHLGNCDWESLRPLRTPSGRARRTSAMNDEAVQLYTHDDDDMTDDQSDDFVFDCIFTDTTPTRVSRVLLVFSGDPARAGSLAARLQERGARVTSYDLLIGGRRHDLTRNEVLDKILHEIRCKQYDFIFLSPPCSSFSVAAADGRPQLRSKQYPQGIPGAPHEWTSYLQKHNKLVEATSKIIAEADKLGNPWAIENPADRGDENSPAFWPRYADQGSLWDLLRWHGIGTDEKIKAEIITVPACSFGADYQKYTTLLCSRASITHPAIQTHRCEHSKHAERLYGNQPNVGYPKTHDAEQYTPKFADALAEAIIQTSTKTNQDDLNQLTYYTRMAKEKSKSKRPKTKQCRIDNILRHIPIPTSYRQVLRHEFRDEIIDAMVKEHNEHLRNKTWVGLVPRTSDMNVVGSTWAWDIKRNVDKCILKFKARLCAQGFTQIKGIDYFRKYSHAVSLETLRLFLAKCIMARLRVTEADYTTAYLNARLDTKIYMKQAEGFEERDENGDLRRGSNGEELVYELDKAIYGLIQSGLMWEEEHWGTLKEFGWEQCSSELTIFKKTINGVTCFLCTYVDNLFMGFPPDSTEREQLLNDLGMRYKINDLGEVKFSLGLCVRQDLRLGSTIIHQKPLIDEIVAAYEQDMVDARFGQRNTPYQPGGESDVQHLDRGSEECKKWQLKSLKLAGKLNYIAIGSRPDISGALSMAMQHVAYASSDTFKLLLCIVKYLSATTNYVIRYQKSAPAMFIENATTHCGSLFDNPWRDGDVSIFCDASQGGARPMMCAIVFIAGAPLAWRMGKLRATTLSSTEAEWFAQTTGATMLQAFDGTLTFLELEPQKPVLSFCDNKSAVLIAESDLSTKRMKHVLTKMAYLQERINEGLITIKHIGSEGMLADIGTKRLSPSAFHRLRTFLVRPHAIVPVDDGDTVKRQVTTDEEASSGGASWTVKGEGGESDAEPAAADAAAN